MADPNWSSFFHFQTSVIFIPTPPVVENSGSAVDDSIAEFSVQF